MKEKNPIDELFKKRLTEGNPPFNEAHWEALEQQLRAKNNRFGFWVWLLPLFLVIGVSVFGVVQWKAYQQQQQTLSSETNSEIPKEEFINENSNSLEIESTSDKDQSANTETQNEVVSVPENENFESGSTMLESNSDDSDAGEQQDEKGPELAEAREKNNPSEAGSTGGGATKTSGNSGSEKTGDEQPERRKRDDPKSQGPLLEDEGGKVPSGVSGDPQTPPLEPSQKSFEMLLPIPLLQHQNLSVQYGGGFTAEKTTIDKFKPRNWRISAVSTFGKFHPKETLETNSERSILTAFGDPTPVLSQSFGLRLDYLKRGWVFSTGFDYSTLNEEVDFGASDSTFAGFEYFEYQEIDSISITTVEVIDSVFVSDQWVYDTTYVDIQDTTFIFLTDSISIYEDGDDYLNERPYQQQVAYFELPLLVGKQLPIGNKGRISLRTGPVVGFRTVVKGYYFVYSGSGGEERKTLSDRREISKSVVLNWKTELEYAYQFSSRMSLGVLIGDRRAISPYFQKRGAKLLYHGQYIGLSLGYLF